MHFDQIRVSTDSGVLHPDGQGRKVFTPQSGGHVLHVCPTSFGSKGREPLNFQVLPLSPPPNLPIKRPLLTTNDTQGGIGNTVTPEEEFGSPSPRTLERHTGDVESRTSDRRRNLEVSHFPTPTARDGPSITFLPTPILTDVGDPYPDWPTKRYRVRNPAPGPTLHEFPLTGGHNLSLSLFPSSFYSSSFLSNSGLRTSTVPILGKGRGRRE